MSINRANLADQQAIKIGASRISIPERVDSWDEYFLWIAWAVSVKSKDPKCPVGAVIVSPERVVLSTGFNGLARGVFDDPRLLAKASEKIKIICHAEQNAIVNAARVGAALNKASIFVTKFPCLACCNAIVQAGITRIYTHDDCYWKSLSKGESIEAVRRRG
jgi:dCMP deaminase